jgi:hypothetical protein
LGWLKINIRKIKRRNRMKGEEGDMGIGMVVREKVGGMKIEVKICIKIKIKIKVAIKVRIRISTRVKGKGSMVVKDKDKGMDKINTVINTKVKVNTAIKDIRIKGTRTKTDIRIEDKAKGIMEIRIPDHTTRINIILDIMLVLVISHLRSLLRGIILRTSPGPLLLSYTPSPMSPPCLPTIFVSDSPQVKLRALICSGAGYNPGNTQQQYQGSQNFHQADGREQGQVKQYFEYSTCTFFPSPSPTLICLHLLGRVRMQELMNRSRKSKSPPCMSYTSIVHRPLTDDRLGSITLVKKVN